MILHLKQQRDKIQLLLLPYSIIITPLPTLKNRGKNKIIQQDNTDTVIPNNLKRETAVNKEKYIRQ